MLSRVLLLSDGCANHGLTDAGQIARRCGEMARAGVTTSTYGLGPHFNEQLMGEMARAGQGNHYYGERADDLMEPFRREFDLLSALCGRHLRMGVETTPDTPIEVLNGYASDDHGRTVLPDLAAGADVWALLKLRVPGAALAPGASRHVLAVSVGYRDVGTGRPAFLSQGLDLRVLDAAAYERQAQDETVLARVQELRVATYQDDIRAAAIATDWDRVDRLLDAATGEAADNPWLEGSLAQLRQYAALRDAARTSKETYYSSSVLRTRMTSFDEDARDFSAREESRRPSFLRRKTAQGKKTGQD
jgi:Ca-activated chloride channel family protein